jgi:hypothetical protein
VAVDLRIPHFVGMHALQLIPLAALLLELLMKRMPALRPKGTRVAIMVTVIALYSGILALLTVQALSGESIVRPGRPTVLVAAALWLAAAVAITLILGWGARHRSEDHQPQSI